MIIVNTYNLNQVNEYIIIGNKLISKKNQYINYELIDSSNKITQNLYKILSELDSLNIQSISADYGRLGIDLKVYLKNREIRLYIPGLKSINKETGLHYLNKAKKIEKGWYRVDEQYESIAGNSTLR